MYRKVLFVTIVILLVSTVALGQPRVRRSTPDISQQQSTALVVSGGTVGFGATAATSGGSVYARQSASEGRYKTARQSAGSSIGSSSYSLWGAVATWYSGWAGTWQSQTVD
jgi:hypothetical protein